MLHGDLGGYGFFHTSTYMASEVSSPGKVVDLATCRFDQLQSMSLEDSEATVLPESAGRDRLRPDTPEVFHNRCSSSCYESNELYFIACSARKMDLNQQRRKPTFSLAWWHAGATL